MVNAMVLVNLQNCATSTTTQLSISIPVYFFSCNKVLSENMGGENTVISIGYLGYISRFQRREEDVDLGYRDPLRLPKEGEISRDMILKISDGPYDVPRWAMK